MMVDAKAGAPSSVRIASRRSCWSVLQCSLGGVKSQVSENLQPQPGGAFGCAATEQQRHLLAVLHAEIPRVEAEKPTIDPFRCLHFVTLHSIAGW
jgi:hypothetical protein